EAERQLLGARNCVDPVDLVRGAVDIEVRLCPETVDAHPSPSLAVTPIVLMSRYHAPAWWAVSLMALSLGGLMPARGLGGGWRRTRRGGSSGTDQTPEWTPANSPHGRRWRDRGQGPRGRTPRR